MIKMCLDSANIMPRYCVHIDTNSSQWPTSTKRILYINGIIPSLQKVFLLTDSPFPPEWPSLHIYFHCKGFFQIKLRTKLALQATKCPHYFRYVNRWSLSLVLIRIKMPKGCGLFCSDLYVLAWQYITESWQEWPREKDSIEKVAASEDWSLSPSLVVLLHISFQDCVVSPVAEGPCGREVSGADELLQWLVGVLVGSVWMWISCWLLERASASEIAKFVSRCYQ